METQRISKEEREILSKATEKERTLLKSSVHAVSREGSATVTNNWGVQVNQVILRHAISNSMIGDAMSYRIWSSLEDGDTTDIPLTFTYKTGFFGGLDYWWLCFLLEDGSAFMCKDNFYCSISDDDDGKVNLILDKNSLSMRVNFSSSSSCSVTLIEY